MIRKQTKTSKDESVEIVNEEEEISIADLMHKHDTNGKKW
ncbi:597_t:CDS:2 [Cetraspora pellucida]|uniref:597_t:CDS:1 n=1 Tax=Cetraspora pellucida TaxID=1433469 RepID=A0A9N9BMM3_9GLOM|nr:597_t:CDS:2 [Cetraspora pellucida]